VNNPPIIQVLGGGRTQKKIIRQAYEQGIRTAVIDRDPHAPGKKYGTYTFNTSTNDLDGNIQIARSLLVDGITTLGTDQPVKTAAHAAHELHLPFFITPETAEAVTNKEKMKLIMSTHDIATAPHVTIDRSDSTDLIKEKIQSLTFPLVIKPVDSQGQRGVALISGTAQLFEHLNDTVSYSKKGRIIIEEFDDGCEVTANAWIYKGKPYLLALTDRVTYYQPPTLGICIAHIYPSKYGQHYKKQVHEILEKITQSFHIEEGPLYVQMVISRNGPFVIELACRIGGGHEDDLIPFVSGVDVRQCLINFALGSEYDFNPHSSDHNKHNDHVGVFFLAAQGNDEILSCASLKEQISDNDLIWGEFYVKEKDMVNELTNGAERIGAFLIKEKNRGQLLMHAERIYGQLRIQGRKYQNLIRDFSSLPLKGV
jgi:biotin carboxylase